MSTEILIVDDEKNIRSSLRGILQDEGYSVEDVPDAEEAIDSVQQSFYRVIFLDVLLPGMDGIQALKKIKELSPDSTVFMMSGHANVEMAVEATRNGAYSFFEKPLGAEKVLHELELLRTRRSIETEIQDLREVADFDEMIGESGPMVSLKKLIARVAPSEGRILITGESGTGKELVARAIHFNSARKDKPFIKINCAALPRDLIESELFGYEKGAFTGASTRKIGQIEQAHTGTLFLDEIGDMSLDTQAKLLRVLEESEFVRLGGTKQVSFDVRILSATNQDLEKNIEEGSFREDLYHRLRVIPVQVPTLRESRDDIGLLIKHFARRYSSNVHAERSLEFDSEAIQLLEQRQWKGNIRELKNFVERVSIMTDRNVITATFIKQFLPVDSGSDDPFSDKPLPEPNGRSMREIINSMEKSLILREYERCNGNVSRVAENLKIDRANLHRKLKLFGLK